MGAKANARSGGFLAVLRPPHVPLEEQRYFLIGVLFSSTAFAGHLLILAFFAWLRVRPLVLFNVGSVAATAVAF